MTPEFLEFPKIARLAREIIVTEKLDGSNGVIHVGEDGEVLAGSRSQWLIGSDNFGFAKWVQEHKDELRTLGAGRHYGEWWGSGIQRGYGLPKGEKRFSLFNVARWDENFLGSLLRPPCCHVVPVLYRGPFLTECIEAELKALKESGSRAAPGFMKPEGVVIFHPQGNVGFKKTIEKDEEYKGKQARMG
jgi:RNA ligase